MAACGNGSTVAVTEDGELLAWGDGQHGELGLGAVLHQHQPARVGGLELFANQRIRQVAAGYRHLAVVAEDGAVYTCGDGFAGQLGLGNRQPRRQLTRVPQAVFAGSRVVVVSCGRWHTMAVTAEGHAWTCGGNRFGQLGVGDTAIRLVFSQVDAGQLVGARIVMAACGCYHSVVVSAEGRVWTFGYGTFGILRHRLVPTLIAPELFEESKIVAVAAGGFYTMAVEEKGRLWAWGDGSYGQLGLGDTAHRLVPTLVGGEEMFGGSKVRMIACGFEHALAATEAGDLWACGKGAQGRLGLNDEQGRLVPTRVYPQYFAHAPISVVAAGNFHSAVVTTGGALYTWGQGESRWSGSQLPGGLGHADLANRLVPTLVLRQLLGGARSIPSHLACNTLAQFIQNIVTSAGISTEAAFGQLRTILEPDLNKENISWEEAMRTVNALTLEDLQRGVRYPLDLIQKIASLVFEDRIKIAGHQLAAVLKNLVARIQYVCMVEASITLQCALRFLLANRCVKKRQNHRRAAALTMQCSDGVSVERIVEASVKIESVARGWFGRRVAARKRKDVSNKRNCAAIIVQRAFRSCPRNTKKPILLTDDEQEIESGQSCRPTCRHVLFVTP